MLLLVDMSFGRGQVLNPLELQTLDWRFRLRGTEWPGGEVALVLADDATVAGIGAWPLPRTVWAEAIRRLTSYGTRVIVLNLLLAESQRAMPPATRALLEAAAAALPPTAAMLRRQLEMALGAGGPDQALAAAVAAAGFTLVPYVFVHDPAQANVGQLPAWLRATAYRIHAAPEDVDSPPPLAPRGAIVPAGALGAAATSAGHLSPPLELDGTLRADLPAVAYGDDYYPSLAVEAARLYLNMPRDRLAAQGTRGVRIGELAVPVDQAGRQLVNYYGPEGTLPTYTLAGLLNGSVAQANVEGKLVILGASAAGAGDLFATPFTRQLPGSEFLATAVDNILTGRSLRRNVATRALDVLATLIMALAAALLSGRRSPLVSLGTIVLLLGGWAVTLQLAFAAGGWWLTALTPTAAALVAGLAVEALRLSDERRRRRRLERQRINLGRYFAPAVVERLAASDAPAGLDRTQEAVVMFVDIMGFTRLSEGMAPAAAMALLREFHTLMERAVFTHRGMVDKFLGDGAMACFGIPDPSPSAPADAIRAAMTLLAELAARPEDPPLRVGIGIHGGPVLMGDIGGATQFQFTVIGDTANVASRLEALTRAHGTFLIVSQSVMEAAAPRLDPDALARFTPLPDLPIRGRDGRLGAWRLAG
ncbi:MAG: CHASE2 domain-containing protein [Geminicoccaceae bacterium]